MSFITNTKGNVTVMFGTTAMMLLMAGGAAIDYNGMVKQRQTFQGYADAAVLAASRSGETKKAELQKIARASVDANNIEGVTLKTKLTINKQGYAQVNVSGDYSTLMMGLFGKPKAPIDVVAESPLAASEPVNLALVVDVTGSMSGTKMSNLQSAATSLVTLLETYQNNNLRMSVVPFSEYVNVGTARRNEVWLEVPADTSTTGAETCYMKKDLISKSGCTTTPQTGYNDGVAYSYDSETCTTYNYGPEYEHCYTPTTTSEWYGCVGSRLNPWHKRVHYGSNKITGLHNVRCGAEMLPLTSNLATVKTTISGLTAQGNTYIPAGLMWGWRTLDKRQPLTEANAKFKKNTRNVMILMTDGANTLSKTDETHSGSDVVATNKLTQDLCKKINDADIEVYAIAYEVVDVPIKNILKDCASDPSMYYDASNSSALTAAFKEIGAMLVKTRLTH